MNKISERPLLSLGILFLIAWYLFFFQAGAMPLTDPDEAFYAQTAKEMSERNEWITPYLYGKPQFEKPILFYWLVELSFKIMGVNEFSARLPSAVFALVGVFGVYFLGSLLFTKRSGFLSALVMASSVEYVILSRACVTDMVLSTFMLFGALFFLHGYLKNKKYSYVFSSAFFALATLTKGPIAIMLGGAAIFLFLIIMKDLKRLKDIPWFWSILVFFAISAPWYAAIYKLHGKDFVDAFFGFHNVTRFLESEHKIGSQFYYNIPIVFGGFLPWSAFLPLGFWIAFKRAFEKNLPVRHSWAFLISWFSVIFVFFSISSTKLPTYIFPCFISLAVIVGTLWDEFLLGRSIKTIASGMKISFYFLIAAILLGSLGAVIFVYFDYPVIVKGLALSCVFLITGFVLSLYAFLNKKFTASLFLIIFSLIIFVLPLNKMVLPEVGRHEASKEIGQILSVLMKTGEALASESNYLAGLSFYTGKFPVDIDRHNSLVNFLSSDKRVWCVLKDKNHRELYELDTKPFYTRPSYMVYKLGKKVIITNLIPEGGKYMLKRERVR